MKLSPRLIAFGTVLLIASCSYRAPATPISTQAPVIILTTTQQLEKQLSSLETDLTNTINAKEAAMANIRTAVGKVMAAYDACANYNEYACKVVKEATEEETSNKRTYFYYEAEAKKLVNTIEEVKNELRAVNVPSTENNPYGEAYGE